MDEQLTAFLQRTKWGDHIQSELVRDEQGNIVDVKTTAPGVDMLAEELQVLLGKVAHKLTSHTFEVAPQTTAVPAITVQDMTVRGALNLEDVDSSANVLQWAEAVEASVDQGSYTTVLCYKVLDEFGTPIPKKVPEGLPEGSPVVFEPKPVTLYMTHVGNVKPKASIGDKFAFLRDIDGKARAVPMGHVSSVRFVKAYLDAALNYNSETTASVWTGSPGSETNSGEDVMVACFSIPDGQRLPLGARITAIGADGEFQVVNANTCPEAIP